MSKEGHNSGKALAAYLERIETLIAERSEVTNAITEVKREAKGAGFDVATMNAMLKLRQLDADSRRQQEELRDLYLTALGLL